MLAPVVGAGVAGVVAPLVAPLVELVVGAVVAGVVAAVVAAVVGGVVSVPPLLAHPAATSDRVMTNANAQSKLRFIEVPPPLVSSLPESLDSRPSLLAEIGLPHVVVAEQPVGLVLHHDVPGLDDVSAIGDPERHVGVLLDEEHGRALVVDLL